MNGGTGRGRQLESAGRCLAAALTSGDAKEAAALFRCVAKYLEASVVEARQGPHPLRVVEC